MFTSPNAIDPFQIERAMPRQCAGNGPGFGGKLEGSERATASDRVGGVRGAKGPRQSSERATAREPRDRSEPSKRRASERVGGGGGGRAPARGANERPRGGHANGPSRRSGG